MERGVTLDASGVYRYHLWRAWDVYKPTIAFILLNPSTADALTDDPTLRRCTDFARRWEYGRLEVVNLFAYRSTDPVRLPTVSDPVGPENDRNILDTIARVDRVVAAWGNLGRRSGRDSEILELLQGKEIYCLGMTKSGAPRHPLYVRADTMPELMRSERSPVRRRHESL